MGAPAEEKDNVTDSNEKKVIKNKRFSLSFEEEDEVKCDLNRDFSAADSILGLSNEEDPMERLDFEPDDPLLEAIDNTIMEPWTCNKDKESPTVKHTLSPPLNDILGAHNYDLHYVNSLSIKNFLICLFTGRSQVNKEPSTPFLCSACVVRSLDSVSSYVLKSDFLFKSSNSQLWKCWVCCDGSNIPQDTEIQTAQVKLRLFLILLCHSILLYLFPFLRYLIGTYVCSGPHPTPYYYYYYSYYIYNFSRSYRRALSSV